MYLIIGRNLMRRSRFVISHAARIRSIFFIISNISMAMNATEAITCYRDANAKEKYSKQDRKRISMSELAGPLPKNSVGIQWAVTGIQ